MKSQALEPYDPCHCGSGKKYKFCCAAIDKANAKANRMVLDDERDPLELMHAVFADDDDDEDEDEDEDDEESDESNDAETDEDDDDGDRDSESSDDLEDSLDRMEKMLGDAAGGDWKPKMFDFLRANLQLPCDVSGTEDFQWEEPYILGGWSQREYARLKKERPSYTDRYELLNIKAKAKSVWMMCGNEDFGAHVRRKSDGKLFVLGLSELKAVDRKSPHYRLIKDFAVWFWNNR